MRLSRVGLSASPRRLYVVEQAPGRLYVGSSARRGHRAARLSGRRRFDLEPHRSWTGEAALRAERGLARRLRSSGYTVRQNPGERTLGRFAVATVGVLALAGVARVLSGR